MWVGVVVREAEVGLAPNMVKRVKQESARAAGWVENEVPAPRIQDLYGEGYEFARGEILAEIAFEKATYELFERNPLGVKVGAVERYAFEVFHAPGEYRRVNAYVVCEHARLAFLLSGIEAFDASGELLGGLSIAALELIRLPVCYIVVLLVEVLQKDQLGELPKSRYGAAPAAFPQGLVTLSYCGAKFFTRDGGEVLASLVLIEAPRRSGSP